jgi:hypothetical protein
MLILNGHKIFSTLIGDQTMTIGNAMDFIKRGINDSELRGRLNAAPGKKQLDDILSFEHLHFSHHEFEEAHRNLLTKCKQAQAANQLMEFKNWWELLIRLSEPATGSGACNGCCGKQSNSNSNAK